MVHFFKPGFFKEKAIWISGSAITVKGDSASQEKWKKRFVELNIPYDSHTGKKEIIFCEGPYLSWKEIIKEISDHPDGAIYLFHGSDTHAAVASKSSRLRGEVIEI
jgi:hypothetical protein